MKKTAWRNRIKKACIEAGTYKPYFDGVIRTLAEVLEKRDEAQQEYEESDEGLLIEQTNKSGFTNKVKNPIVSIWEDMNKLALNYWRDLGLTPAGLKKINEEPFAKTGKQSNNLLDLLERKKEAEKR